MHLAALSAVLVLAAAPNNRPEASAEVRRLLQGGNPHHTLARLQYLGEQRYAATLLMNAYPELEDLEAQRKVSGVLAGLAVPNAQRLYLEWVSSTDSTLRMNGAVGLGNIKSKQVAALVPLLGDVSAGVRREAAKALCAGGDRQMGAKVVAAAKIEGEPDVRAVMLEAAGRCRDPKTVPALATFLDSSSESARFAAARGLCLLGARQGFEFAKGLLASDDRFVRRQGVALFESLPAKEAKKFLEPMLEDSDRRVAAAAARVLYQGGDARKLEWLVVQSHLSKPEDKLAFEAELETLMLTDDRRKAILKKAGMF